MAADGQGSAAAREAGATDEVSRNTRSQTTAASYTTTDHEVIRTWAQARGGAPATIAGTEDGEGGGVLRIEFDRDEQSRNEADWDTFFEVFDERGLAFVYQEKTSVRYLIGRASRPGSYTVTSRNRPLPTGRGRRGRARRS